MEVTSSSAQEQQLTVSSDAEGMRLDVFLLEQLKGEQTRGDIQRSIRNGFVAISNKRIVKPSTTVREGQVIMVKAAIGNRQSATGVRMPNTESRVPNLKILHEDPSLIVIDKPAGVPVHEGVRREPTLADALVERYPGLRDVGEDPKRPGIVHRLDKETSGVLLIARTQEMYEHLKEEFQQRRVRKEYLALVHGVVTESHGSVKLPITRSKRNPLRRTIAKHGEGKDAETEFRVLERFREHTLLVVYPRTGRMHQIRVHLAHLGFPVAGDPLYGRKSRYRTPPGLGRQFLHAHAISVKLPSGKLRTFASPLAEDLAASLGKLRNVAPPVHPQK
ncbi:MAG: 23S rRNA pseudouridine synthase [Parcubacteria group bacterium Gr01-1014_106]|nr:MAG: 23S rRNA pseudouridine synthase [Parcubacteria group bacterium Gr01-1014_106]